MRVRLLKPAYVGDALYPVPTRTVRGAEVFIPVEVDLPDEAARDLVLAGTVLPVDEPARTALDPAHAVARKGVKLGG